MSDPPCRLCKSWPCLRQCPNSPVPSAAFQSPGGFAIARSNKGTEHSYSSAAVFSDCGTYRFRLWRLLKPDMPRDGKLTIGGESVCFVMLNPSTATHERNDPTVERCERRAFVWGFKRYDVVNLFALRSTDPRALFTHRDPVGPDNLGHIMDAAGDAAMIVAAWGAHASHKHMGARVADILAREFPGKLHALRVTAGGYPAHPLYLPYSLAPQPWRPKGITP